jgi:serine protease Do
LFWLEGLPNPGGFPCGLRSKDSARKYRGRVIARVVLGDALTGFAILARWLWLLTIAALGCGNVQAAADQVSSAGAAVYASAPPRLLQIRTLVSGAGQQTSNGSAFLVSADGLAVTNYHVVSQVVFEPHIYRLEYTAADGTQGEARLLGVDLPNDLAIVQIDRRNAPFFAFDPAAIRGDLPKGDRLYSMGNPLDLGFTIVEGTYNGLVDHSYNDRIHFTGALNPGMSGGPAVTAEGKVAGVNVATRRGGQLVSFLVPARFAEALLQRVRDGGASADLRAEIARQIGQWRSVLYKSLGEHGFRSTALGPYLGPETAAPWFNCWAQTNAGATPKPRANLNSTSCTSETSMFVASDLNTGNIQINHSYVRASDLNQFQFATYLAQLSQPRLVGGGPFRKWYTPERCHEDFVGTAAATDRPSLRVMWCARAYREFEDLYDVVLVAVTQDDGSEALVSRLSLQAVGYDDAMGLGRRFLDAVRVNR